MPTQCRPCPRSFETWDEIQHDMDNHNRNSEMASVLPFGLMKSGKSRFVPRPIPMSAFMDSVMPGIEWAVDFYDAPSIEVRAKTRRQAKQMAWKETKKCCTFEAFCLTIRRLKPSKIVAIIGDEMHEFRKKELWEILTNY